MEMQPQEAAPQPQQQQQQQQPAAPAAAAVQAPVRQTPTSFILRSNRAEVHH